MSSWTFDAEALLPQLAGADALICLCFDAAPAFDELTRRLAVPTIGFQQEATLRLSLDQVRGMSAWDRCHGAALEIDPRLAFNNFAWMPQHPDAPQIREAIREQVGDGPLLVVHPDTKPSKMWPLQNWKRLLAQMLAEDPELHIIMVGYPAIPFDRYGQDDRLIDCRDLSLMASFEIVAMADWFIGIDSCMLHVADLSRVPGVGIFTDDYPACDFGFRFSCSHALHGHNPPDDVEVEAVHRAFTALRQRTAPSRRHASQSAGVSEKEEV